MIKSLLISARWINLIFIVIIQFLMRFCVIKPLLSGFGITLLFSDLQFSILVLITVLLAASGNFINDYFDFESDLKAKKRNHHPKITKNLLLNIHLALNIVAIALSFYISFKIHFYKLGFIFIIIAGLLWFYSSSYKKIFLVGNLIIALLAAMVPLIILPYELLLQFTQNKDYLIKIGQNLHQISFWIIGYSAFAFIFTLIREIIKDIEDMQIDISQNYNTLPIVLGEKSAKIVSVSLIVLSVLAVLAVNLFLLKNVYSIIYSVVLVVLPSIFLIYKLFKAKEQKDYKFLSNFTKLIMLLGVLYSVVFYLNS